MKSQLVIVELEVIVGKLLLLLESDAQCELVVTLDENMGNIVLLCNWRWCAQLKDKVLTIPPEGPGEYHAISVRQAKIACYMVDAEAMEGIVCPLYVVVFKQGLLDDVFESIYPRVKRAPF